RTEFRRPAARRDHPHGRPDDLPGPDAGTDRRGAEPLMLRDLRSSAIAVVVLTLLFGLALPVLFTGFAQLAFPSQADGSLIKVHGQVVGSRLAAQGFTRPKYFHPRPSATAPPYNDGAATLAQLRPPP